MAVSLLDRNYQTGYCEFSYDDWNTDKDSIPTMNSAGKEKLSTISKCAQGSMCIGTDGTMYTLKGETNEWIPY